jgi:hypothetical protein
VTEDQTLGIRQNEAFSSLLAVVRRLEWEGLTPDGVACCPSCAAARSTGYHDIACELKSALDGATMDNRWPWCHCDACECPNQVDPALLGTLCQNCGCGIHHAERAQGSA